MLLRRRFREKVERLKFTHTVATPTLPQMPCADFLDSGGYERQLRGLRRKIEGQVLQMTEAIAAHFPAGTRVSRPLGGYVLWVEMPPGTSALDLHTRALERGISVAPGPIFSAKQRFGSCIRLSCGYPWSERIDRAVATLGRLAAGARWSSQRDPPCDHAAVRSGSTIGSERRMAPTVSASSIALSTGASFPSSP